MVCGSVVCVVVCLVVLSIPRQPPALRVYIIAPDSHHPITPLRQRAWIKEGRLSKAICACAFFNMGRKCKEGFCPKYKLAEGAGAYMAAPYVIKCGISRRLVGN